MKIIIFVQARMNSKRLPGKVLLKIRNKSILKHVIDNLKYSKQCKKIVVLTSKEKSDQKIVNFCKKKNILYFRGDLNNVYKRYILALKKFKCDAFVRICADSPLINHIILDKIVKKFRTKRFDIVTNCFPKTYPKGLSVEIFKSEVFIDNFKNVKTKSMIEHISKYFYKNYNKFKIFNLENKDKKNYKSLAIDGLKDYKYLEQNFKKLSKIKFS